MLVKTEIMQIKERELTDYFYLRRDKGDLKGFQTNFKTLFLQETITI